MALSYPKKSRLKKHCEIVIQSRRHISIDWSHELCSSAFTHTAVAAQQVVAGIQKQELTSAVVVAAVIVLEYVVATLSGQSVVAGVVLRLDAALSLQSD